MRQIITQPAVDHNVGGERQIVTLTLFAHKDGEKGGVCHKNKGIK